jgi:hypothetical protein
MFGGGSLALSKLVTNPLHLDPVFVLVRVPVSWWSLKAVELLDDLLRTEKRELDVRSRQASHNIW